MIKIAVSTLKTLVCQLVNQSLVEENSNNRVAEVPTKLSGRIAWQLFSLMYDDAKSGFGFDNKVVAVFCVFKKESKIILPG
jgi:hypothetical protein